MRTLKTAAAVALIMAGGGWFVVGAQQADHAVLPTEVAAPELRLTPEDIIKQATAPREPGKQVLFNGDPSKPGLYSTLVNFAPHRGSKPHRHRDNRVGYVVSGTLWVGYGEQYDPASMKPLPPGSYYTEPAGVAHYTEARDEAVVAVVTGYGPTTMAPVAAPVK